MEPGINARWFEIRKWYFICWGVILIGLLAAMLTIFLGIIAAYVGLIGLLIVIILKIVCLYNTATYIKNYRL